MKKLLICMIACMCMCVFADVNYVEVCNLAKEGKFTQAKELLANVTEKDVDNYALKLTIDSIASGNKPQQYKTSKSITLAIRCLISGKSVLTLADLIEPIKSDYFNLNAVMMDAIDAKVLTANEAWEIVLAKNPARLNMLYVLRIGDLAKIPTSQQLQRIYEIVDAGNRCEAAYVDKTVIALNKKKDIDANQFKKLLTLMNRTYTLYLIDPYKKKGYEHTVTLIRTILQTL